MSFDRSLSATESGSHLAPVPVTAVSQRASSRWATRIFLVIEVVIWVELGMILVIVPWTRAWTDNGLVLNYPRLREFLAMDFIRGVISGIGLLDIWVGVWQAIRYKDPVSTK